MRVFQIGKVSVQIQIYQFPCKINASQLILRYYFSLSLPPPLLSRSLASDNPGKAPCLTNTFLTLVDCLLWGDGIEYVFVLFFVFKTWGLYVVLTSLELAIQTKLASNSVIPLHLSPEYWLLKVVVTKHPLTPFLETGYCSVIAVYPLTLLGLQAGGNTRNIFW